MGWFTLARLELTLSLSLRRAHLEVPGSAFLSAGLKEKKTMRKTRGLSHPSWLAKGS